MKNIITNIQYYDSSCDIKAMDLNGETYIHYHTIVEKGIDGRFHSVNVPKKAEEAGAEKWEQVAIERINNDIEYTFYKVHCADGEVINIFCE